MAENYSANNIILEKTCNQLTKEDILTIIKEKGTIEDKNELKAMIASGKNDFSTIRSWAYFKFIKKDKKKDKTSKDEWLQALLDI